MSNAKTIYLHIGLPKTGTTAFQKFCIDNVDYLASKGITYYRPLYREGNGHEVGEVFVRPPVFNRDDLKERIPKVLEHLRGFSSHAFDSGRAGLISAESISWFRTDDECQNLKSSLGEDIYFVIILCLRDVDDWWASYKNHMSKGGSSYVPGSFRDPQSETWLKDFEGLVHTMKRNFDEVRIVQYADNNTVNILKAVGVDPPQTFSEVHLNVRRGRLGILSVQIMRPLYRIYRKHLLNSVVGKTKRRFFGASKH